MNLAVRVLGAIDLVSAIAFLMLTFGVHPYVRFVLFCAGLLLLKGMFVFKGDILSVIDILSSIVLLLSLIFTLPSIILWIPTFLLMAKGVVSFM